MMEDFIEYVKLNEPVRLQLKPAVGEGDRILLCTGIYRGYQVIGTNTLLIIQLDTDDSIIALPFERISSISAG